MTPAVTAKLAEKTAPTAELRGALSELRREIEILKRRERIRETQLEHLRTEVQQARRLQRELIQSPLPEIRGANVDVISHPAEGVSGDFYHVRRISAEELALIVADATGHGIAAGLLSATVMGLLHAHRESRQAKLSDPASVLEQLHQNLLQYHLSECEFVAAVYAVYNERTRVLRLARAGAPRPILLRRATAPRVIDSGGMPLGVDAGACFTCAEMQLEAGDTVLLHTDGLEAMIARNADNLSERMLLEWHIALNGQDIRDALQELISSASPDADTPVESDDTTLLSLHIN